MLIALTTKLNIFVNFMVPILDLRFVIGVAEVVFFSGDTLFSRTEKTIFGMANIMFSFNKSKFLNQLNVRQFFFRCLVGIMVSNYMQMKQLLNAFIISIFMCAG